MIKEFAAYTGDAPWKEVGTELAPNLSAKEMLQAAGLDWGVHKLPLFAKGSKGKQISIGREGLFRDTDDKFMDVVGPGWEPCQNLEAFEFFNDFITAGEMQMHVAGSLKKDKLVFAMAKINDSFELFKGDRVDPYLLFTNPHKFGQSIDIRFTANRHVCNNGMIFALHSPSSQMVKVSHRRQFNPEMVKELLGVSKKKLEDFKEVAAFLGSKKYKKASVEEYFNQIFPVVSNKNEPRKELSKSAEIAFDLLDKQPGHEFAPGSWWQAANAVTYLTDHLIGRNADNRLTSAWYGANKNLKVKAFDVAVQYAKAA